MHDLVERVRRGEPRAVARAITRVENSATDAETLVTALYPATGTAHIVGVTGPPGSGKSTLVSELAKALRRRDLRVGIVAVDPSSPFTGGAFLGDRVRMRDLAGDSGIFIRSMASRGSLGGLAAATAAVIKVLDAAGFDVILVETVGAGQAEVDIASTAHTTLVIEAPGMGDDVQSIKAGILEIADILIVNKADRPGAERTVRTLEMMLHLGAPNSNARTMSRGHHGAVASPTGDGTASGEVTVAGWTVTVQETVATEGAGIEELVEKVLAHRRYLDESGEWQTREQTRSRRELEQLLRNRFIARLEAAVPREEREQYVVAVAERRLDPYTAANRLFATMSRRSE